MVCSKGACGEEQSAAQRRWQQHRTACQTAQGLKKQNTETMDWENGSRLNTDNRTAALLMAVHWPARGGWQAQGPHKACTWVSLSVGPPHWQSLWDAHCAWLMPPAPRALPSSDPIQFMTDSSAKSKEGAMGRSKGGLNMSARLLVRSAVALARLGGRCASICAAAGGAGRNTPPPAGCSCSRWMAAASPNQVARGPV